MWFVRGSTDTCELSARGVKIWDANGSRAALDALGGEFARREEGDLGPVYGFQWRHSGAQYVDKRTDYSGEGVDQLSDVIDRIRQVVEGRASHDRRIMLVAWNPRGTLINVYLKYMNGYEYIKFSPRLHKREYISTILF